MKRSFCGTALRGILSVGILLSYGGEAPVPAEGPKLREWRAFPLPAGTTRATPRPSDAEFLKVLPPLRPVPAFDADARELGLAIWWGDPSVQVFSEQPPLPTDLQRKAALRTPPGEDEPLVLGLWGIKDVGPVKLTVHQSPIPVTIRRVDFEQRKIPEPYYDDHVEGGRIVGLATYLLPENRAQVVAGANTVFWIDADVPKDTQPGDYNVTLSLSIHPNTQRILPVTLRVLPFDLPRADVAYGMYFRPFYSDDLVPPRYKTPHWIRTYWRDMARHGMTSATIYHNGSKFADESGRVSLRDLPEIQTIREMIADGLVTSDVPIMYLDGGGFRHVGAALAAEIRRELQGLNLPEFLYYGPDEPAVNDKSRADFASLQRLRKSFRIVTAISDVSAAAYADMLDVWVVSGGCLTPEIRTLAAEKKAALWTYDCHHRGKGNTPWSRYYAGLYTWALGLKGNFLWAYTEGYRKEGGNYLPWSPLYCNVLPSDQGLLASLEWEARREGVEDYRTLKLLESRIAAAQESPVAKQAREWLDKTRSRVDWYLARNMPPSMYPWDGPELYPMCPDFDQTELSGIRTKAQDYILLLAAQ